MMNKMKVLVTGGAGFIGSHLCEKLIRIGHEVTCVDSLDPYYNPKIKRENIAENKDVTFIEKDIRDKDFKDLLVEEDPDYIIHEAAQAGVRASVKDPIKTNSINVEGTLNLLETLRDLNMKKIIFASSSSIYGKVEYLPFDEEHPKNPISPYGVSKLAGEHYLRVYSELYGIRYAALRYFTVYGPRIRPDLAIHKFTSNALQNGKLQVYGGGGKSRDFTYVDDAVEATTLALKKGQGPINVGGGTRISVKELAEKIIEQIGSGEIEYVADEKADVKHTHSNTEKARKELGWKPKTSFDEGLKKTVEWIRENQGTH